MRSQVRRAGTIAVESVENVTLKVSSLEKNYESFTFGPETLSLKKGECVALLGHNGAGKSTFFQMITGQMDASKGSVEVLGDKLLPETFEIKKHIGYLPQNLDLPDWVNGREILRYAIGLYKLENTSIEEVEDFWAITPFRDKPLASCSHGMRKRVGLALATIHEPDFLILDEPFSGLDVAHIRSLSRMLEERSRKGKTSILSTHVIPYAAKLCNRGILISKGKMQELDNWKDISFNERIDMAESKIFAEEAP